MDGTIFLVLLNLLILSGGVSSTCVHVPNDDMVEYSCVAGNPSDLYSIPERAEKIRIANMTLTVITSETFSRFGENLWVLTCSHCGIEDITPDAFKTLLNLQQLRLDNNKLREVKASWFEGMNYLTYLDFNYNEITHIEDEVYRNLPSLVDFRISGNKLECLNVDAMSNLGDLKRIFLSKNPEFKCPNVVTKFLEDRQVNFEKDPDWRNIPQDLVPASLNPSQDWRTPPVKEPSTPSYHEKLIARITEDSVYYDDDDPISSSEYESQPAPPGSSYPNRGWSTSSPAPYPAREWPASVPTSDQTNREWPTSMPNSYPTRGWPTAAPYPTRSWPAPTDNPPRELPEFDRNSGRYETNYPPQVTRTSTVTPMENRRMPDVDFPPYVETGNLPVTMSTNGYLSPGRTNIEWAGNSAEIFTETDYSTNYDASNTPSRQTNPPSMSGYPIQVHEKPMERPTEPEEFYPPPPRESPDNSHPQILDKYQQVQEPTSVTMPPIRKETDKPLPDCNSASIANSSIVLLVIGILGFLRPFSTI